MNNFLSLSCIALPFAVLSGLMAIFYIVVMISSHYHFIMRFGGWVNRDSTRLPAGGEDVEQQLTELNFEFMGVAKALILFWKPMYLHYYVDAQRIVLAELEPLQGMDEIPYQLIFQTRFEDQSMFITRYPVGEAVITPHFVSIISSESIIQAYHEHMERVSNHASLAETSPVQIHTLDDILTADKIYEQRYKRLENRSSQLNVLAQTAALITLCFACCVLMNLVYPLPDEHAAFWLVIAFVSMMTVLILSTRLSLSSRRAQHGKRKKHQIA